MRLLSFYGPQAARSFVYMLQQVEYSSPKFLRWLIRLPDVSRVQHRQRLQSTSRARLLTILAYTIMISVFGVAVILAEYKSIVGGVFLLVASPFLSALLLALANILLGNVIVKPTEAKEIASAQIRLDSMKAERIAVLGSYGKTTMKELLATVLSEGKRVAATPGNKNVLISHARWINKELTDSEEVLIFEYGEAKPGDIKKLAAFSRPGTAIITGLSPAHLENYKTLDAVAQDLSEVLAYAKTSDAFINGESVELTSRIKGGKIYSGNSVDDWKVRLIQENLEGLVFEMIKHGRKLHLKSGLVGSHLLGTLALVVAIADKIGLTDKQIVAGVAATKPFKHRMQPYRLGGAWVIDDTYNGNLEGMKAGLRLLSKIEGARKTYVTPGLVEQGKLKESVHVELGKEIASAAPDKVVLMKNSTTEFIRRGLEQEGYKGELQIEDHPLDFYANLEHMVASGDVVLMQNDWTDNYN